MSTTGRPLIPYPPQFKIVYDKWKAGDLTAVKAMSLTGLSKTTFYRMVKEYEENPDVEFLPVPDPTIEDRMSEREAEIEALEAEIRSFTASLSDKLKAISLDKLERMAADNNIPFENLSIKQVIQSLIKLAVAKKFPQEKDNHLLGFRIKERETNSGENKEDGVSPSLQMIINRLAEKHSDWMRWSHLLKTETGGYKQITLTGKSAKDENSWIDVTFNTAESPNAEIIFIMSKAVSDTDNEQQYLNVIEVTNQFDDNSQRKMEDLLHNYRKCGFEGLDASHKLAQLKER